MNIIRIDETTAEKVIPLIADFRVTLKAYKGIRAEPDPENQKRYSRRICQSGQFLAICSLAMKIRG